MKKFFVFVTISLFLSALCAPVFTVSAQEPQKKECTKDAQKCNKEKKACSEAEKKACSEVNVKAEEKKKAEKKKKK